MDNIKFATEITNLIISEKIEFIIKNTYDDVTAELTPQIYSNTFKDVLSILDKLDEKVLKS